MKIVQGFSFGLKVTFTFYFLYIYIKISGVLLFVSLMEKGIKKLSEKRILFMRTMKLEVYFLTYQEPLIRSGTKVSFINLKETAYQVNH